MATLLGASLMSAAAAPGTPGTTVPAATVSAPAPAPDLDAVVSYETRQELPSGVARIERWRERLVRRGDTVWTERLAARANRASAHDAEPVGHRHFDADAAARLLTRDGRGRTQLRYVDAARRLVVAVPQAEWDSVGFDGRHDAAAHLVPPALVERMPVERGAAAARGAIWHLQRSGGWTHRVLWSPARQVALRIESRSDDGRSSRTVTLRPQPSARAESRLPWRGIDGYDRREYDDFMD